MCKIFSEDGHPKLAPARRVFEDLVHAGANVHATCSDGTTLFHLGYTPDDLASFSNLGLDVNAVDNDGRTPLHAISRSISAFYLVEPLLRLGARVNAVDANGVPPLQLAIEEEHLETARILVHAGAAVPLAVEESLKLPLDVLEYACERAVRAARFAAQQGAGNAVAKAAEAERLQMLVDEKRARVEHQQMLMELFNADD